MKRVILHIGQMKTGTSAIQNTLYAERESLKKHDIYYPYIKPANHCYTFWLSHPGFKVFGLDTPLIFLRKEALGQPYDREIEKYIAKWTKMLKNNDFSNFIISTEIMSLMNEDDIRKIKDLLCDYFDEFLIVAYVRHYDTLIDSLVQQHIRSCYNAYTVQEQVDSFLNQEWNVVSYRFIQKWINVFGEENIVVRPYDKTAFKDKDLISDFLEAANLDIKINGVKSKKANIAIGKNAVEFLVNFNKKFPCVIEGKLNEDRGAYKRSLPFNIFRVQNDEKFYHNAYISEENIIRLNDEIEWVNQFFDDNYKFSPFKYQPKEDYNNNTANIPTEFYVEVVNEFAKLVDKKTDDIEKHKAKIKKLTEENKKLKRELSGNSSNLFIRFLKKIKNKIKRK